MKSILMNSRLVVAFLLVCISPSAIAQWYWQNPLPQGNCLNAVSFATHQTGYAVGEKGTIIKTQDGGVHWHNLDCGSTGDLNSLWFSDADHGWVVGSNADYFGAIILYTENGGLTWETKYSSTIGYGLHGILFTDTLHGFAVGSITDGMLVTGDGGNTWSQSIHPGLPDNLRSIFFRDGNTGWVAGTGDKIYKTSDQGNTWTGWPIPGNTLINSVFFPNSQVGYAVGSGPTILKSVNGGQTWSILSAGIPGSGTFNDVCFINPDTGWVTGRDYYYHGLFLHTFDGGLTWQNDSSTMVFEGKDISFLNASLGWCTGNNGTILKTTNSGSNWITLSHRITGFFSRVQFLDTLNGWISGKTYQDWGDPFTGGIVIRTEDGGWNWETTWTDTAYHFNNMQFFSPSMGWVIGESISGNRGMVLKTTDGGLTWMDVSPDTLHQVYGLSFISPDTGWIAGKGIAYNGGEIYRTNDGGMSWELQLSDSLFHFTGICFVDDQSGWATRYLDDISRTTDGGQTWITQSTGAGQFLFDVLFVDDTTGWIAGWYTLAKTIDGGNSWIWIPYFHHDIYDLCFLNHDTGWAAGGYDDGIIMRTVDGGENWISLTTPTNLIFSGISFPDPDNGWVTGSGGCILHTGNSGGFPVSVENEARIPESPDPWIRIYPNPAKNSCTVSWPDSIASPQEIRLYNTSGMLINRWVNSELNGSDEIKLDIADLRPGMYYLVSITQRNTTVRKLLVIR